MKSIMDFFLNPLAAFTTLTLCLMKIHIFNFIKAKHLPHVAEA